MVRKSLCIDPLPLRKNWFFLRGLGRGVCTHRIGHKGGHTVTYFLAATLVRHQPPYYSLLTQTHFQISGEYWWRSFFFDLPDLLIFQPRPLSSSAISDRCAFSYQACWENSLSRSAHSSMY